jgi:hypothetical protein
VYDDFTDHRMLYLGYVSAESSVSEVNRGYVRAHHVTKNNMSINNILSTAPQLSISQKSLGTLPEEGNVMPKHVGATIHN